MYKNDLQPDSIEVYSLLQQRKESGISINVLNNNIMVSIWVFYTRVHAYMYII